MVQPLWATVSLTVRHRITLGASRVPVRFTPKGLDGRDSNRHDAMFTAASLPTANRWEPRTCPPAVHGGAAGGADTRECH